MPTGNAIVLFSAQAKSPARAFFKKHGFGSGRGRSKNTYSLPALMSGGSASDSGICRSSARFASEDTFAPGVGVKLDPHQLRTLDNAGDFHREIEAAKRLDGCKAERGEDGPHPDDTRDRRHLHRRRRQEHLAQHGRHHSSKNVRQINKRHMNLAELGQIVFKRTAEFAAETPYRQQARIDCELDELGFLFVPLAQLIIHNFQMALRVDPDNVDPGAHVDQLVADRDRDACKVLLGGDENVLPVLKVGSSVLQLDEPGTEVAYPFGEQCGLLAATLHENSSVSA